MFILPQTVARKARERVAMEHQGYYKISDIVRTPGSGTETLLPICRSTWLNGVDAGKFPRPVKLLGRNVWRKEQIHQLMDEIGAGKLSG